jgi:hypothetical protein
MACALRQCVRTPEALKRRVRALKRVKLLSTRLPFLLLPLLLLLCSPLLLLLLQLLALLKSSF